VWYFFSIFHLPSQKLIREIPNEDEHDEIGLFAGQELDGVGVPLIVQVLTEGVQEDSAFLTRILDQLARSSSGERGSKALFGVGGEKGSWSKCIFFYLESRLRVKGHKNRAQFLFFFSFFPFSPPS